eukprot:1005262-Amphidinium_carterae.1
MASSEEVLDKLECFASCSTIVGKERKKELLSVTHSVLQYFDDEYSRQVVRAYDRPLLQSLSLDGTPVKVRQIVTTGGQQARKVMRRSGQDSLELLCMVTWLRSVSATGEAETRCKVGFPKPLRYGKDSWSVYGCVSEFQKTLRDQGHR